MNSFKSECVAEKNKLKKSVADCAQSIDRICDEESNGIATIKSDVRQIRSDVTSIDETLDLRCIELGNKISALNKHEKRIVKLENKLCKRQELSDNSTQFVSEENSASSSSQSTMTDSVAKQKGFVAVLMNTKTSDSSNLLPGLGKIGLYKSPESLRIKRAPTLPVQHSLVKNNDLINFSPPSRLNEFTSSKSGSHNETVANSPADSTSHGHDKSRDNRGAIRKSAFDDEQHTDNGQTTAISGTTIPLMGIGISAVPNGSVSGIPVMISERNSERQDNRPPTRSRYGKDQPSKQLRVIPTGSPEEDNDDDFVKHVRRRTKRFYVGGFLPSITEKKLINYAARRGVTLTWVNIHRYERQNRAVIRVNVEAAKASQLLEEGFWPKGVMCRPWLSKGQFQNRFQKIDHGNGDDENGGAEVHVAHQSDYNANKDAYNYFTSEY